jgi:hypothetical protein
VSYGWTDYYEYPSVPLFYPEEESYHPVDYEPTAAEGNDFYYFDEPTQQYYSYQPSEVNWNDYYEQPSTPLYYYDTYSNNY